MDAVVVQKPVSTGVETWWRSTAALLRHLVYPGGSTVSALPGVAEGSQVVIGYGPAVALRFLLFE